MRHREGEGLAQVWAVRRRLLSVSECERGGQIGFDALLVDAGAVQRSGPVLEFEQCQQQVFGADVVVAQAKCLAEGQLEHLAGRAAEGDQRRGFGRGGGQRYGGVQGLGVDLLQPKQHRGQRGGIAEHPEQQMGGGDLAVGGVVRGVLSRDHRSSGSGGEPAETLLGVQRGGLGLRHEPLLGGLFGDAHALADIGPGRSRAARLIDEVPDQVVGDLAQMLGRPERRRRVGPVRCCGPS